MLKEICVKINGNFISFWQRNREIIDCLLKDNKLTYLSIELDLFLGEFLKKNQNNDYKYVLRIYSDEGNCYAVFRDLIAERIISDEYEIFSSKRYNVIDDENANILYAYSEAIKECSILDFLERDKIINLKKY